MIPDVPFISSKIRSYFFSRDLYMFYTSALAHLADRYPNAYRLHRLFLFSETHLLANISIFNNEKRPTKILHYGYRI